RRATTRPTARRRWAAVVAAAAAVAATTVVTGSVVHADEPRTARAAPTAAADPGHQWLTGYWHNFDNGSTVLRLTDVCPAYNMVASAFADNHPTLAGGLSFEVATAELDAYTDAQFRSDLAAIRAQGRSVVLSVGGERGNVVVTTAERAQNFATTMHGLMQ